MTTTNPGSDGVRVRTSVRTALAAAAALAVLAAGSAPAAAASPSQGAAITTQALFAKVHRAYLQVSAVELTVITRRSTIRIPRRFVLVLRSGVVIAEEFTRSGREGTTLVARRHQPTYARTAGAKCWRRLPSSDPQTLFDVGMPFPYSRLHTKALQPRRTASGWKVLQDNRAEYWFLAVRQRPPAEHKPGGGYRSWFITYTIDPKSHRFTSILVEQPSERPEKDWIKATLRVTALTAAPRLPKPAPAC